jgi:hypothetical protein
MGLGKNRRDNVMSRIEIRAQIIEQISVSRFLPEVMMGIDDREFGFENFFLMQGEPFRIRARIPVRSFDIEPH